MALIDSIQEVIGDEAAAMLVESFGGRKLYVPVAAHESHPITKLIGAQPAAALSRRFGGEYIDVPSRGVRRKHILALAATGLTSSQIARQLGCSRQWVSRVLNEPA